MDAVVGARGPGHGGATRRRGAGRQVSEKSHLKGLRDDDVVQRRGKGRTPVPGDMEAMHEALRGRHERCGG